MDGDGDGEGDAVVEESATVATAARPVGTAGGNTSMASTRMGSERGPGSSKILQSVDCWQSAGMGPQTGTRATRWALYW